MDTKLAQAYIGVEAIYEELSEDLILLQEGNRKLGRIDGIEATILSLERDADCLQRAMGLITRRKDDEYKRSLANIVIYKKFREGIHSKGKEEQTWAYGKLLRKLKEK